MCTNPYCPIPPPKDPEELLKEAERIKEEKKKKRYSPTELLGGAFKW
jgi:hypothetical protein